MFWNVCMLWNDWTKLINICITSHAYLFVDRTVKIYSQQFLNVPYAVINYSLYNRSLELIPLALLKHWLLWPICPQPPIPGNHHSILCFYEFNFFRFCIWVKSWGICFSVTGLFHPTWCKAFMPGTTFSLFIHLCWTQVDSISWLL
jgi:hypothetical protein